MLMRCQVDFFRKSKETHGTVLWTSNAPNHNVSDVKPSLLYMMQTDANMNKEAHPKWQLTRNSESDSRATITS